MLTREMLRSARILTSADPAANTEAEYVVPAGLVIMPLLIRQTLVRGADAANVRTMYIYTDSSDVEIYRVASASNQTANATYELVASQSAIAVSTLNNSLIPFTLPVNVPLFPGWKIKTLTTALQANDNYGVMKILAAEL